MMMYMTFQNRLYSVLILLFSSLLTYGQQATYDLLSNPKFHCEIESYLSHTVHVISVSDAKEKDSEVIFLDARELEEYNVSHIPNAIHIGYDHFKMSSMKEIPKDSEIVVYCSIGYRSEKIGEKLQRMGYTKVQNLYGSIFEWANQGQPLQSTSGLPINKVHTYNRSWSKWMDNSDLEKVW